MRWRSSVTHFCNAIILYSIYIRGWNSNSRWSIRNVMFFVVNNLNFITGFPNHGDLDTPMTTLHNRCQPIYQLNITEQTENFVKENHLTLEENYISFLLEKLKMTCPYRYTYNMICTYFLGDILHFSLTHFVSGHLFR